MSNRHWISGLPNSINSRLLGVLWGTLLPDLKDRKVEPVYPRRFCGLSLTVANGLEVVGLSCPLTAQGCLGQGLEVSHRRERQSLGSQ